MTQLTGRVFITGGAGFLGRGIIKRAHDENWDCQITVFSRDEAKHDLLKRMYPDLICIRGDVGGDYDHLLTSMKGHDIVIHAAATKIIPVAERNAIVTIRDNVIGSINVAQAAAQAGVSACVGISTDKVGQPINTYGATKMLLERVFQEAQTWPYPTNYHLVRYGNVLDSTASVLALWKRQVEETRRVEENGRITLTNPTMTRFWLSIDQAVDLVLLSLVNEPGTVTIPMLPALRMLDMATYVFPEATVDVIGTRPGEKVDETLLTAYERPFAEIDEINKVFILHPSTSQPIGKDMELFGDGYYSSEPLEWLQRDEFLALAGLA